jgi:hypothetical protein
VGSIIFGAAIALVGQMYHVSGDFAGGMLLWAMGALAAAALTGSRGALAVALAAASIWSWMRIFEVRDPHFSFVVVWLIAAGLALAWKSRVAAHLVAVAAVGWWIAEAVQFSAAPSFLLAYGAALLFGADWRLPRHRGGRVVGRGCAVGLWCFRAGRAAIFQVLIANEAFYSKLGALNQPLWATSCGRGRSKYSPSWRLRQTRRTGVILAGIAIGLVLLAAVAWTPSQPREPWHVYAFELCAMLLLVVSAYSRARARGSSQAGSGSPAASQPSHGP